VDLTENDRSGCGTLVADAECAVGELERAVALGGVSIVQFEDGVAGRHLIAGLRHQHDPDRMIDRIFDAIAACAQDY
jgi:hypothetical protein